jgi:hypothetical protein
VKSSQVTADRFFIKFGKSIVFLLITILIIGLFELISWNILIILKERYHLNDGKLQLLYNTKHIDSFKEMLSELWGRNPTFRREPFVEFVEKEYRGKYVTISPYGFRYIKEQETNFINENKINIFVFGGSTTFGYGVSNIETIPSYIQEILNKKYGGNIAVYNFGCGYHYSSQERIWFEQFIVNEIIPDIVIFIDGLNDFYFSSMKDVSNYSDQISFIDISSIGVIMKTIINESPTVALLRAAFNELCRRESHEIINAASVNEIRRAAYRLSTNRKIIRNICDEFKITPIFVQQPVPTYNYDNNKRPVPVDYNRLGRHINSRKGYEMMVEQANSGEIKDNDIIWCQNLKIDSAEYVDTVHYSSQYNLSIANSIVDYINAKDIIRHHKKWEKKIGLQGKISVGPR